MCRELRIYHHDEEALMKATKPFYHLNQWSSMWTKSPSTEQFYMLWGQFCDLRDFGNNFSFQEVISAG